MEFNKSYTMGKSKKYKRDYIIFSSLLIYIIIISTLFGIKYLLEENNLKYSDSFYVLIGIAEFVLCVVILYSVRNDLERKLVVEDGQIKQYTRVLEKFVLTKKWIISDISSIYKHKETVQFRGVTTVIEYYYLVERNNRIKHFDKVINGEDLFLNSDEISIFNYLKTNYNIEFQNSPPKNFFGSSWILAAILCLAIAAIYFIDKYLL